MDSWIKGSKALVFMEHLHKESEADEEGEALPSFHGPVLSKAQGV